MPKLSTDERKWRAQSDFHTLASAQEIQGDPKRLKAAQAEGAKIVAEEQKALAAKKTVAQPAKPKKVAKKTATKGGTKTRASKPKTKVASSSRRRR